MANEISQDGFGNIALQDVQNSTINITQQLGKSVQYQELTNQLKTLQDYLFYIPESEIEKRLSVSNQINELESFIKQFKEDISELAETFNRIEINSERLEIARNFFNEGKFDESREYLQSKIEEIKAEQSELLKKRESYEQEILPKLEHSSMEFLLLALSTASDFSNPNNFIEACEYFELSIKSFEAHFNVFPYAQFLANHNNYPKAKEYWEKCLKYFDQHELSSERAELLNNIANAYYFADDYENAKIYYGKALLLGRKLNHQKQTKESKSFIAYVLNNLGVLLTDNFEIEEAEIKLSEALEIRKSLANDNLTENLDNLAVTLLGIGRVFVCKDEDNKAKDSYNESLRIFESLKDKMPFYSLKQIALVKNNLGDLSWKTRLIKLAEKYFIESLNLYMFLLSVEPHIIAPNAVSTLVLFSEFYQGELNNKEKSLEMAFKAAILALPLFDTLISIRKEFAKADEILISWGLNDREIEQGLEKTRAELSIN